MFLADPKWFVHDSPLDGGDNEDLFSSEQLLPVQLKTHKNPKPAVPHITPKKQDQSHGKHFENLTQIFVNLILGTVGVTTSTHAYINIYSSAVRLAKCNAKQSKLS